MIKRSPRSSDGRFMPVAPAKSGVQVLNGSRVSCAIRSWFCVGFADVYLWVADPRQVTFSCLSKRKSPKRRTPRAAHRANCARSPALLTKPGARLTRRAHTSRLGLDQKSREDPRLRCGARLATRGPENPSCLIRQFRAGEPWHAVFNPRMARPSLAARAGAVKRALVRVEPRFSAADELASARAGEK